MDRREGRLHWAWIVLAVCFADLFINYSARLGYGVVFPEMIRELGLSRTAGGTVYNAYLLTYVCLTPFTGYLTDVWGARRVIAVCAFFLGVGLLLMGTATGLGSASLFYAIVGLGATGMWTPVITVVQRWFAPHRRGLALGILSTGYGLGFASMGAFFPYIVTNYDWRWAWYFLGAGALVMVAANGLFLRSDPERSGYRPWGLRDAGPAMGTVSPPKPRLGDVARVFRRRNYWLIGCSYFFISYALYGITTFMVDYAQDQLGLPLDTASRLATVHGAAQVVGVLTFLPLSDRVGRKATILLSNTVIAVCLAGIVFTAGKSAMLLFFWVGLLAVFYGITFPIYGACAGDYFPRELMGTVIGTWTPFYGLGAILVHWVGGYLRDASGNYTLAFTLNIVAAAAAAVLFLGVRPESGPAGETDQAHG